MQLLYFIISVYNTTIYQTTILNTPKSNEGTYIRNTMKLKMTSMFVLLRLKIDLLNDLAFPRITLSAIPYTYVFLDSRQWADKLHRYHRLASPQPIVPNVPYWRVQNTERKENNFCQ